MLSLSVNATSPRVYYPEPWKIGPIATVAGGYQAPSLVNTDSNASLEFSFNGSSIALFSADDKPLGFYGVSIDEDHFGPYDGSKRNGTSLFSHGNLTTSKQHTLKLFGTADPSGSTDHPSSLSLAYIQWTSVIPSSATTQVYDDQDPIFVYSSGWETGTNISDYFNNTSHITRTSKSSTTLLFNAVDAGAIAINGGVSNNHGQYDCTLDGSAERNLRGDNHGQISGQQICFFDNLSSGPHKLEMIYRGKNGTFFDVDSAQIWLWNAQNASSSTDSDGSTNNQPVKSSKSADQSFGAASIAGCIIGGLLLLCAIAASIYLLVRRRRRLDIARLSAIDTEANNFRERLDSGRILPVVFQGKVQHSVDVETIVPPPPYPAPSLPPKSHARSAAHKT